MEGRFLRVVFKGWRVALKESCSREGGKAIKWCVERIESRLSSATFEGWMVDYHVSYLRDGE